MSDAIAAQQFVEALESMDDGKGSALPTITSIFKNLNSDQTETVIMKTSELMSSSQSTSTRDEAKLRAMVAASRKSMV